MGSIAWIRLVFVMILVVEIDDHCQTQLDRGDFKTAGLVLFDFPTYFRTMILQGQDALICMTFFKTQRLECKNINHC